GEAPCIRIGGQPRDDVQDFHAIQPDDREDRSELDHHRERASRVLESEQLLAEQQVRRRRHGQKFRQALNDPEKRGEKIRQLALALRCDFDLRAGAADAPTGAAVAVDSFDGLVRRQNVTMAAATNTLEYVPVMMPTIIVNANPCSTSPPNRNSAMAESSAVPAVMTVRPRVWVMEMLMMSFSESRRVFRMFS